MKCQCLCALVITAPLFAQPVTLPGGTITPPVILQQTFTTGMVGFTTNQTARLNVLNLNSSVATTAPNAQPPANCTVGLQFWDNKGNLVTQSVVPNFAPGAAASFDLPRASVTSETAARAEIRGAVVVNPSATVTSVGTPGAVGNCAVFITLEVFDSTGSTVLLTSDTRAMGLLSLASLLNGLQ